MDEALTSRSTSCELARRAPSSRVAATGGGHATSDGPVPLAWGAAAGIVERIEGELRRLGWRERSG